jgi:hypothetical protein
MKIRITSEYYCGGGGIRTPEGYKPLLVFKTSAFSQALPPLRFFSYKLNSISINFWRKLNKYCIAERVGFEPTVRVNAHTLSKRAP